MRKRTTAIAHIDYSQLTDLAMLARHGVNRERKDETVVKLREMRNSLTERVDAMRIEIALMETSMHGIDRMLELMDK